MTNIPISGGGVAANSLIWEWNKTDLSQFTDGADPEVDDGNPGTLSVVTGRFDVPVLRVTAGAAAGLCQWAVNTSEFPNGFPERYLLEYYIDQADDGGGGLPSSSVGISQFCQYNGAGDVLAHTLTQYGNLNAFVQVFTRNTTFGTAGTTPTALQPGSGATRGVFHRFETVQQVGATFDIFYQFYGLQGGGNTQIADAETDAGNIDLDAGNYDNETPNTIGIAARFFATSDFFDFRYIRLLTFPGDEA